MGCNECNVISINGVACHENGCPKSWIDPVTETPYKKECKVCGVEFEPEDRWVDACEGCNEDYDIFE